MRLEILAATLLLMIPALLNGYPLVFPDTGTYLRQALEWYGVPDRPPYYSLLILPLHLGLSLWPVALAQAAAGAVSLRLAARFVAPKLRGVRFVAGVAALTAFTSLPWHTGQVVPDVLAGLLVIWIFALAYAWTELGRLARLALVAATAGAIATHQSHLPLALALFALAALLRAAQGFGARDAVRVAGIGAFACAAAAASFLAYGLALVGRPTLSPHGSVFLMARLVADGPALAYLRETCPASGNAFCSQLDQLDSDPVAFLWKDEAAFARVAARAGDEVARRAAGEVVAGTIAAHPAAVAAAFARNTALQLVRFGTLDTLCPPGCWPGSAVDAAIARHFPGEHARFRSSRQLRKAWPISALRELHGAVVGASSVVAVAAFALAWRRGCARVVGFSLLVAAALVANAFVAGALSGPWDRYQSRVIWLVPFAALLGYAWASAQARAARP